MLTFEEQWRKAQVEGTPDLDLINSMLELKADRYQMQNEILDHLVDLRRFLDMEELNYRHRIEKKLDAIEELVNAKQIP